MIDRQARTSAHVIGEIPVAVDGSMIVG